MSEGKKVWKPGDIASVKKGEKAPWEKGESWQLGKSAILPSGTLPQLIALTVEQLAELEAAMLRLPKIEKLARVLADYSIGMDTCAWEVREALAELDALDKTEGE